MNYRVSISVKEDISKKEISDRIKQFQLSFVEAAADYYSANYNKPEKAEKVKIPENKESA
jgi:hypothetical protein